ncbi:MAG: hypothetical protein MPN21_24180 [Thermoanaerobaculia bacterium]|nr:hypothetical protein [Thermoanaerobaculia bacterium]
MLERKALPISTVAAVMAWEFWSLGRRRILSALVGIGCLNALLYRLVTPDSGGLPETAQLNLFVAIFLADAVLIALSLVPGRDFDENGQAFDTRAFLLPLPTWLLAASKIFFPTVTAGLMWLVVSAFTLAVTPGAATGPHWPLLGPALVAATFTAAGLAFFWLPLHPWPLRVIVGIGMLAGPMAWTSNRFAGPEIGRATRMWVSVSATELATLVGFLTAAFAIAIYGTVHARRGTTLGFSNLGQQLEARLHRMRQGVTGAFRSQTTAQLWFEWREKGWIVPANAVMGLIMFVTMADENELLPLLSKLVFLFLLVMPLMIGCLMGRFSQSSRDPAIDLFRASRPVSDTELAHTILKAGALSVIATWIAAISALGAVFALLELTGSGGQAEAGWLILGGIAQRIGWLDSALGAVGLVWISWTMMALVTTVFLTGRNLMVAGLVVFPYALGLGAFFTSKLTEYDVNLYLFEAGAWLIGLGAIVLTMVAFLVAGRRRLLAGRTYTWAVGLWLASCSVLAWRGADSIRTIIDSGTALEAGLLLLAPGALALSVAPLALAPLAVAWNRHR